MGSNKRVATTVRCGRLVGFMSQKGSEKQKGESGRLEQFTNKDIMRGSV